MKPKRVLTIEIKLRVAEGRCGGICGNWVMDVKGGT